MSELDDFLGPRRPLTDLERPGVRENLRPGPGWKCEDPVRIVLERFATLMLTEPRSAQGRHAWIAGGRDYVRECGETPDLLEVAFRQMDRDGLTIKTPRSLIAVALQLQRTGRQGSFEDRGRYLHGKLADND